MPDNLQNDAVIPEHQNPGNGETAERPTPVEAPEVAGKSVAPQSAQPADDQVAAQNISQSLQNSLAQTQQNNSNDNNQPIAQPIQAANSSEPYIKAAENVMQKDRDDPYQEEEDHEDVQIQYLHDRFGKDMKKGDEG